MSWWNRWRFLSACDVDHPRTARSSEMVHFPCDVIQMKDGEEVRDERTVDVSRTFTSRERSKRIFFFASRERSERRERMRDERTFASREEELRAPFGRRRTVDVSLVDDFFRWHFAELVMWLCATDSTEKFHFVNDNVIFFVGQSVGVLTGLCFAYLQNQAAHCISKERM